MIYLKLLEFFVSDWLVISVFKHCEHKLLFNFTLVLPLTLDGRPLLFGLNRPLLVVILWSHSSHLENFDDLLAVVALGPLEQRLLFVVHDLDIDAFVDKVFTHFYLSCFDCVEHGGLAIDIDWVRIASVTNKALSGFHITFPNAIINGSLAVCINMVDITTIADQVFDDFVVSFSASVVKGCLIKVIDFGAAHSYFLENLKHL